MSHYFISLKLETDKESRKKTRKKEHKGGNNMPRSKKSYPGVFQTDDGNFGYRFVVTVNGHQKTRKKVKDENGNPFKTRIQAANARAVDIERTKAG